MSSDPSLTKLVIIRGPSAVGKSTVAAELMRQVTRPTILVDLDYYRFSFVNAPPIDHDIEFKMSASDVMIGLKEGFDVILEGNFTASKRDEYLKGLFNAHPKGNYLFYLDASLGETLKRHQTKQNPRIDAKTMRERYKYAAPTCYPNETIVPEHSSLEQTVQQIMQTARI